MPTPLSVVSGGKDAAKKRQPKKPPAKPAKTSVADASTRLEELRAIREVVAKAIDSSKTLPRDLSSLTRRLMDIRREIEEIEQQESDEHDSEPAPDEPFDPETD
jgi:hypothetical protein